MDYVNYTAIKTSRTKQAQKQKNNNNNNKRTQNIVRSLSSWISRGSCSGDNINATYRIKQE